MLDLQGGIRPRQIAAEVSKHVLDVHVDVDIRLDELVDLLLQLELHIIHQVRHLREFVLVFIVLREDLFVHCEG